tara:strand:+ start:10003 stop:10770 length:768 start_codon:yes stop_codon:yes gene_type:complete
MKNLFLTALVVATTTTYAQNEIDSINSNVNPSDILYFEVEDGETDPFATLGGSDEDGADNLTISFDGVGSAFTMTPASANVTSANGDIGQIEPVNAMDADTKDEYLFNTTITDAGGLDMTVATRVVVKRKDIDDIQVDTVIVPENSNLVMTTTMSAWWTKNNNTAKKINKNKVTLEILSIDGTPYSVVNGVSTTLPIYLVQNDQLQITAPLDHEKNEWVVVKVKATRNSSGQSYEEDIYINVTNVNENPFRIYVK